MCCDDVESFIRRVSRGIINTYFPRRKPARIRTDNFLQREHIHIVLTVPLFEPLLDDLVDVAVVPGPLG